MRHSSGLTLKFLALLLCAVGLSSCFSPFSQDTDYTLAGLEDNQDTHDYLDKILDDRLAEDIDYEEGSEAFARAETNVFVMSGGSLALKPLYLSIQISGHH